MRRRCYFKDSSPFLVFGFGFLFYFYFGLFGSEGFTPRVHSPGPGRRVRHLRVRTLANSVLTTKHLAHPHRPHPPACAPQRNWKQKVEGWSKGKRRAIDSPINCVHVISFTTVTVTCPPYSEVLCGTTEHSSQPLVGHLKHLASERPSILTLRPSPVPTPEVNSGPRVSTEYKHEAQ